jgi:hypothetical protein
MWKKAGVSQHPFNLLEKISRYSPDSRIFRVYGRILQACAVLPLLPLPTTVSASAPHHDMQPHPQSDGSYT